MTRNEILQAIIDGKQFEDRAGFSWSDATHDSVLRGLGFGSSVPLRIKPEPKPDVVVQGGVNYNLCTSATTWGLFGKNIAMTFNGDTGSLKSIRMLGKPCPEKMEAILRKLHSSAAQNELNISSEASSYSSSLICEALSTQ